MAGKAEGMRVKVLWPYRVVHEGLAFTDGDTPVVPQELADSWILNGWAALAD
jgi:hypothetical protein